MNALRIVPLGILVGSLQGALRNREGLLQDSLKVLLRIRKSSLSIPS